MRRDVYNTKRRGDVIDITMETTGGFDNAQNWLTKIGNDRAVNGILKNLGNEGVNSLAANTPKDTGQTASGWGYSIESSRGTSELSWHNFAHPNITGGMARMLYTGYGNRTGGYTPPRDYITPAMEPLYNKASYRIVEEILNG